MPDAERSQKTIHIEMLNSEPETSTLALCSNQAITLAHILLLFGLKQAGSDESLLSLLLSLFRFQTAKDWQDVGTSIAESLNRVLQFAYICSLCQQGKLLHASISRPCQNLQPASNLEGLNLPFFSQGLSSGLPGFPKLGETTWNYMSAHLQQGRAPIFWACAINCCCKSILCMLVLIEYDSTQAYNMQSYTSSTTFFVYGTCLYVTGNEINWKDVLTCQNWSQRALPFLTFNFWYKLFTIEQAQHKAECDVSDSICSLAPRSGFQSVLLCSILLLLKAMQRPQVSHWSLT